MTTGRVCTLYQTPTTSKTVLTTYFMYHWAKAWIS